MRDLAFVKVSKALSVITRISGTEASMAAFSGTPLAIVGRAGSSAGVAEGLVASEGVSMFGIASGAQSRVQQSFARELWQTESVGGVHGQRQRHGKLTSPINPPIQTMECATE